MSSLKFKYFNEDDCYAPIPNEIIDINNKLESTYNSKLYLNNKISITKIINYKFNNFEKHKEFKNMNLQQLINYYLNDQRLTDINMIFNKITKDNFTSFDKTIENILNDTLNNSSNNKNIILNKISLMIYNSFIDKLISSVYKLWNIELYIDYLNYINNKFNLNISQYFNFNSLFFENFIINSVDKIIDDNKKIGYNDKLRQLFYSIVLLLNYNIIDIEQLNIFINDYIYNINYFINKFDFIELETFYIHLLELLLGYDTIKESFKCNYNHNIHDDIILMFLNNNKFNNIKNDVNNFLQIKEYKNSYFINLLNKIFNNKNDILNIKNNINYQYGDLYTFLKNIVNQ